MTKRAFALLLASAFLAVPAIAETAYVSDRLVITVRTAPSPSAEIVEHLNTGDAVEVLERPAQGEFVRVRVAEDGVEGWALAQYLMLEPAARGRLAAAQREASEARSRAQRLESRLAQVETDYANNGKELESALSSKNELTKRLEEVTQASQSALALRDENAGLKRQVEEQQQKIDGLIRESAAISDASKRDWFLVGAGVLFAGILLGLLLPRLRRRKRWDW